MCLFYFYFFLDKFNNDIFPSLGGIVSIDKLTIFSNNSQFNGSIPIMVETPHPYQHVGVGLFMDYSLMGTFSFLSPLPDNSNLVTHFNMMYSATIPSDPWIVLDVSNIDTLGECMPLSLIKLEYEVIYSTCATCSDLSYLIKWVDYSYYCTSSNNFSHTFSNNESIMEIMM